jgi:hypothetical protein
MMQETRPERALSTELGREEFVQAHLRRIYLQVYRIVGNADDAQDLTQEVFIKALQRNEQIQDAQKAAHWLSDWKWSFKLVGGLVREIRPGINSEKRCRAARRKAADSTLPRKSSSELHR